MTLPPTRRVKDSRVFSSSLSALEVEVFAVSLHLSRRRRARRRARRRRLAFFSFSWKKSDMKRQDRCLDIRVHYTDGRRQSRFMPDSRGAFVALPKALNTYANKTTLTEMMANIPAHVARPLSVAKKDVPYASYAAGHTVRSVILYTKNGAPTSDAVYQPNLASAARSSLCSVLASEFKLASPPPPISHDDNEDVRHRRFESPLQSSTEKEEHREHDERTQRCEHCEFSLRLFTRRPRSHRQVCRPFPALVRRKLFVRGRSSL